MSFILDKLNLQCLYYLRELCSRRLEILKQAWEESKDGSNGLAPSHQERTIGAVIFVKIIEVGARKHGVRSLMDTFACVLFSLWQKT